MRRKTTSSRLTLRGLAAGRYRISAGRVHLRRAYRGIRKGATALPTPVRQTVRLRAGKTTTVVVDYASLVNSGVRTIANGITAVQGPADAPEGLTLNASAAKGVKAGTVLTSGPTTALPAGLLHRVVAVKRSRATATVTLQPASVTDAAPKISYDGHVPLAQIRSTPNVFTATLQANNACDLGVGGSLKPIVQVSGFRPNVDIDATPWGGSIHADVTASLRLTLGYQATTSQLLSCELEADALTVVGAIPVGPVVVPIYFTIPLKGKFEIQAATTITRTVAFDTTFGIRTERKGLLLIPQMVLQHGEVQSNSTTKDTSTYTLGVSAGAELGIGLPKIANLHATLGTDLTFTRATDRCDLDWNIGTLSAGGQVGPLKLGTPTYTPAKVHLWDGCHDGPLPPQPPGALKQQDLHVTSGSYPRVSAFDGGGNLWVGASDELQRVSASGQIDAFPIPDHQNIGTDDITTGPDGNAWFADLEEVGTVDHDGYYTVYDNFGPDRDPNIGLPNAITAGPDANLWFTDESVPASISQITTYGTVTRHLIPTPDGGYWMRGITQGPDHALWFTQTVVAADGPGDSIGRMTTDGTYTNWPLPTPRSDPMRLAAGPDGALWFTERTTNSIGRISTTGQITEYPVPITDGLFGPSDIAAGRDGAMWFTTDTHLGRITTSGQISTWPVAGAKQLGGITAAPDGSFWVADGPADLMHHLTP